MFTQESSTAASKESWNALPGLDSAERVNRSLGIMEWNNGYVECGVGATPGLCTCANNLGNLWLWELLICSLSALIVLMWLVPSSQFSSSTCKRAEYHCFLQTRSGRASLWLCSPFHLTSYVMLVTRVCCFSYTNIRFSDVREWWLYLECIRTVFVTFDFSLGTFRSGSGKALW